MSDKKAENSDSAVPFFARYLEDQSCEDVSEEEAGAVFGGVAGATKKYPSDHEDGSGGGAVTLKFPSDQEDGGGGVVTLKYPSDADECKL